MERWSVRRARSALEEEGRKEDAVAITVEAGGLNQELLPAELRSGCESLSFADARHRSSWAVQSGNATPKVRNRREFDRTE